MWGFYQQWQAKLESEKLKSLKSSKDLQNKLSQKTFSLQANDSFITVPAAFGLKVSFGLWDAFAEYSYSPGRTLSLGTGFSF